MVDEQGPDEVALALVGGRQRGALGLRILDQALDEVCAALADHRRDRRIVLSHPQAIGTPQHCALHLTTVDNTVQNARPKPVWKTVYRLLDSNRNPLCAGAVLVVHLKALDQIHTRCLCWPKPGHLSPQFSHRFPHISQMFHCRAQSASICVNPGQGGLQ